ncbi:hypothetical protein [Microbacterium sp.]|uniref:hypothetical protein n=1 Tax=Microbacterium sp. TaxID=51671 RepID=UPI00345AD0C0
MRGERDEWSEAAPSPDDENTFIEQHGWTEFSHWHLGVDRSENPRLKAPTAFRTVTSPAYIARG